MQDSRLIRAMLHQGLRCELERRQALSACDTSARAADVLEPLVDTAQAVPGPVLETYRAAVEGCEEGPAALRDFLQEIGNMKSPPESAEAFCRHVVARVTRIRQSAA